MDTIDDIDEDETFINELMALHPNDEDIIVEDIEANEYNNLPPSSSIDASVIDQETINNVNTESNYNNNNNSVEDSVRIQKSVFWVFLLSLEYFFIKL